MVKDHPFLRSGKEVDSANCRLDEAAKSGFADARDASVLRSTFEVLLQLGGNAGRGHRVGCKESTGGRHDDDEETLPPREDRGLIVADVFSKNCKMCDTLLEDSRMDISH